MDNILWLTGTGYPGQDPVFHLVYTVYSQTNNVRDLVDATWMYLLTKHSDTFIFTLKQDW